VLQRYWRLHMSATVSALSLHKVDVNKVQDADRWVGGRGVLGEGCLGGGGRREGYLCVTTIVWVAVQAIKPIQTACA